MSLQQLQSNLVLLRTTCEQEQEALVKLDSPALARIVPQKTALLVSIKKLTEELAKTGEPWPAAVVDLATRCRRLNAANRRMLVVALRCINELQQLFVDSTAPGYRKSPRRRRPSLDSRV